MLQLFADIGIASLIMIVITVALYIRRERQGWK